MPHIQRVSGISPEQLWSEFVLRRTPVIITDLLEDFPDRDLETIIGRFRDMPNTELAPKPDGTDVTLGEWLASVRAGVRVPKAGSDAYSAPTTDLPMDYTRQAKRFYEFADALKTDVDRIAERLGLAPLTKGAALTFFGFQEATTCHTDGWVSETLTAHVAGAKEWFLCAPENVAALGPYGAALLADPMKLPLAERDALAAAIGGYSFTVQSGETLYWPHQWLHGTWYPEPSISFVTHFGRDLTSTFIAREVYRGFYRHAILEKLYPADAVFSKYMQEFQILHDACKTEYDSPRARFLGVETCLRAIYDKLYPDRPLDKLPFDFAAVRSLEESEGERFYVSNDLEAQRKGWQRILDLPAFNWW
ncbi:MAG TPA: hypothetical protein VGM90_31110 [Kofleriaceae bacterium]